MAKVPGKRNRGRPPVFDAGAPLPAPSPRHGGLLARQQRDGRGVHANWTGHCHERWRRRAGQRLFQLSRSRRRRRRRQRAAPRGNGRRISAEADGGLRQRSPSRRGDDGGRALARRRRPPGGFSLVCIAARARDDRRGGTGAGRLSGRRSGARHPRLRVLPWRRWSRRRFREPRHRRPARRLHRRADQALEDGRAPQRPAGCDGRSGRGPHRCRDRPNSRLARDLACCSTAR